MKPLIVANWKANPAALKDAISLARTIERGILPYQNIEVVIAPPFPFLLAVGKVLKKIRVGAQNTFWEDIGPYTGEVSWRQLKNCGVRYVIIGHSERRIHLGETDEMVNKKVKAVLANNLIPILCIGERERRDKEIPEIVGEQLKNALRGVKRPLVKNLVVAYEPIWAISTMPGARPDSPDDVFRAALFIRKNLADLYGRRSVDSVRIIYGGSVNATNIGFFLSEGKMEGALVGGASLDPQEFIKIVARTSLGGEGSHSRI